MENKTYRKVEQITEEARRNIVHKELETPVITSIETLNSEK